MAGSRNSPSIDPVLVAVSACLRRHVSATETVVVGFSGGLDSTVLLHAVSRIAPEIGIHLSAIHIHHGLSPNADGWAESCAAFAGGLGVPLDVKRVVVPRQTSEGVEACARRLRRAAIASSKADWIVLGHHVDDQAETVLQNLLRGAGVRGAAAMGEALGSILRPLLLVDRGSLLAYANSRKLSWVDDESNADRRYTRNFLRHEVLALLVERFPAARRQLAAAAKRFGEAEALLDDLARIDLAGRPADFPLEAGILTGLSEMRARNLVRALLAWKGVQAPTDARLSEFVRQLRASGNDRCPRIDLPTYALWRARGKLHFAVKE